MPDWLADDPELLAVGHAMLVQQCQLGLGYPVAISEAHEQAVITGHNREEFRRATCNRHSAQANLPPESALEVGPESPTQGHVAAGNRTGVGNPQGHRQELSGGRKPSKPEAADGAQSADIRYHDGVTERHFR